MPYTNSSAVLMTFRSEMAEISSPGLFHLMPLSSANYIPSECTLRETHLFVDLGVRCNVEEGPQYNVMSRQKKEAKFLFQPRVMLYSRKRQYSTSSQPIPWQVKETCS